MRVAKLDQIGAIGGLLPDLLGAGGVGGIDISAIEPLLLGLVGSATGLGGIDQILAIVGLASAAGGQTGGAVGVPVDLTQVGDLLAGLLGGAGAGAGTGGVAGFDITTLLGLAGVPDLSAGIDLVSGLLGGGATGAPAIPGVGAGQPIGQLPDLSSLLGIISQTGTDPSAIIGGLIGSTRVVNANYAGDEREALLSMLKVAYSQAYDQAQTPAP